MNGLEIGLLLGSGVYLPLKYFSRKVLRISEKRLIVTKRHEQTFPKKMLLKGTVSKIFL
jgi:hypothetical protein